MIARLVLFLVLWGIERWSYTARAFQANLFTCVVHSRYESTTRNCSVHSFFQTMFFLFSSGGVFDTDIVGCHRCSFHPVVQQYNEHCVINR